MSAFLYVPSTNMYLFPLVISGLFRDIIWASTTSSILTKDKGLSAIYYFWEVKSLVMCLDEGVWLGVKYLPKTNPGFIVVTFSFPLFSKYILQASFSASDLEVE